MAKPILVANWKNHPSSLSEAKKLLSQVSRNSNLYKKFHFYLAPPHVYWEAASSRRSFIKLVSQDMFIPPEKRSYTGEITPDILKSFGVRASIIGHSEQRSLGESSKEVSTKVRAAIYAGITPIMCVGELSRDGDGEYLEVLREQIKTSLSGLEKKTDISKIIIAYEPIWAIGKHADDSIEVKDLVESVIFIKKVLADMFGRKVIEKIPILYGGSTEPENARELSRGTGIRGFLVGHASLDAKDLADIAKVLI